MKAAEKDQTINSFTGSTAVPQPPYTHEPVETAVPKEQLAQIVQGAHDGAGGLRDLSRS